MDIGMNKEELMQSEQVRTNKAKKFSLWLGMIGMFMMFAALSSGFIVYTATGVDKGIKTSLPSVFIYSTLVIVLSSITMHLGYLQAKVGNYKAQRLYLIGTIILGLLFFVFQLDAWTNLVERGIYFVNPNASQSFLYVFTGLHLAHIIAGLLVLVRCLIGAFKKIDIARNSFRMELGTIFWHFLDLLWIYIYVFLLLNQ